jgi:PAS domain S-box-containing protein
MRPDDVSRAVVDGIGAIVWEARPGREPGVAHFTFVSDGTIEMLGHAPERWIEDPRFWLSICHPDDRERVIGEIVAAAREGRGADFEFRAEHADGRRLWLRDIVRVQRGEDGVPRMSGLVVDVTERKLAEERLARVHAVSTRLSGLLQAEEVGRVVVAEGRASVGAVAAAVHVLEGDRLLLLAAEGYPPEVLPEMEEIRLDAAMASTDAVRTRRPVWMASADEADRRYPARPAKGVGGGAMCALPLIAEDRVIGTLVARMASDRAFAEPDRVLLDVLAAACAQALLLSQSLAAEQRTTALLDTIIDKAPEGWALFDTDLRYLRVNEALARINGIPASEHVGRRISEIVPDVPDEAYAAPVRRVAATGEIVELEVRGRTAADPERDHVWRATYYPVRGPSGEIEAVGALIDDITDRKRNEERAALLASLGPILEQLVGVEQRLETLARTMLGWLADHCTVTLLDGETLDRVAIAHVDPAGERALAMLPPTDVEALGPATVVIPETTDETLRRLTDDERELDLYRQIGSRSGVVAPMSVRGRRVGSLAVGSARPRAFGPEEVALVEEVAKRAALAVDNARLYESERAARERTGRMQTITAALSEALTPADVAGSILRVGMPAVGSHMGGVWQVDGDGVALVPLAYEGYPDREDEAFRHVPLSQPTPLTDALREGRMLYLPSLDAKVERWPHLRARFEAVGAGSLAVLPLVARGEPIGSISLSFPRQRALDAEDLAFLESLASQCAQALERARLYEAERLVAATLQRSLLPQRLPTVDGFEFAVRYLPAAGLAAGGDFYEAIQLPDGTVGVAVGDVVGRGANAAASMGQLRSALKAFAFAGAGPGEVLARLSSFADTVEGALAATAAYAVLDPAAGEIRYACAGHPWPVLAGADGEARFLTGGRSLPLACVPDPVYPEAVEPLAPGDTLLLFTDGLTERRGVDVDDSLERLRAGLSGFGPLPLAALLDAVIDAQGAGAPLDDVALLAVRMAGPAAATHHLRIVAAPERVAAARSQLRGWLADGGVDAAVASDVLLAAGEALANAAEHAYRGRLPGDLELMLRTAPEVEVELRDFGSWKDAGGDPDRGRGFTLMRALMHDVEVERTPGGTTVRMRRRLTEAPPAGFGPDVEAVREPVAATVSFQRRDHEVVALVVGDVDFFSSTELGERLAAEAGGGPLVVDLSAAGYLDSAGARMLVELGRRVPLAVVAPAGTPARRALEIAELDARVGLRP